MGIAHRERVALVKARAQRTRRRGDASVGRSRIKPGWLGRGRGGPSGLREASPIVNVLLWSRRGRDESGVGAMHPSGEAKSSGMTGPRQRRIVRLPRGVAHVEGVAQENGSA